MKYAPLYVKTHNSLLSSMIKIDDYIRYAKEMKYNAIAIADNTMYGVLDFYYACISNDIKPVIGLELLLDNNKIVLYCMDNTGYTNLCKLYTISGERLVNVNDLEKYSKSLICILPQDSDTLYFTLNKIYKYIFQGYVDKNYTDRNTIYFNEVLYFNEEDYKYHAFLTAIKESKLVTEVKVEKDKYFKSFDSNNYDFIYSNCNLKIPKYKDLLVIYDDNPYELLKKKCIEGLKVRFGQSVPRIYLDRLKYELSIINKMGFCNYFLVVQDYVMFAKNNNILVGPGRGSAASSLVAYLLFITEIDPIRNNLLFERFLNPERITMPDIDVDFEDNRRIDVINYCINKYGIKKVASIITFSTLSSKQVIRDVAKVMDINTKTVDRLTKLIDSKLNLEDNYKKIKEFIEFNKLQNLYNVCLKLEGIKKNTSINAAGILMCKDDLDLYIPIKKTDSNYVSCYSKDHLEEFGLLKMDLLAVSNLTLINNIVKKINNLDIKNIPLNDLKTLQVFSKGNTLGIFQFESNGMINFLKKLKPSNFEDIVAANALFRPGPMDNIDLYIKRKRNLEKIDYFHQDLEPILKSTYGIIVYQEQIMMIANVIAGYTYAEADVLRRAMSKKKQNIMLEEKNKFIKRGIEKGYKEEIVNKIYDLILKFSSYGFNKAHAVAYSTISYTMAYLKAHYTQFFMKELLDDSIGSSSSTKKYINESILFDLKILPPDINCSNSLYSIENDTLRVPFGIIKGVGFIVDKIIQERTKSKFIDIFDFVSRVNVDSNCLLNLNNAGCFINLGTNIKTINENIDLIMNYSMLSNIDKEAPKPLLKEYEEYDEFTLSKKEKDVIGFYLKNNPITKYKIKNNISISLSEIDKYFDKTIDLILYVENIREVITKNNEKMCFLTCNDEISKIDAAIFPKTYKNINVVESSFIKVKARVEKRFDKYQLVIFELKNLQ